MDDRSVTRPSPPSTLTIVADEAFCAQAAAVLGCEEGPIRNAFLGEPAEEVLQTVRWALSHQEDDGEGFDAAQVLTGWAKKRGRGAWSGRARTSSSSIGHDLINGKLAEALASFWARNPHKLAALLDRVQAALHGEGRSAGAQEEPS